MNDRSPPSAFAKTDTGKVRKRNEDTYLIEEDMRLYVVADGMGGHRGGDVASDLAVRRLRERLTEQLDAQPEPGEAPQMYALLQDAVREANVAVHDRAEAEPELANMGTTLTGVALADGRAYLAHVGDSRAYRIRGDAIEQLTADHTVAKELASRGVLNEESADQSPLSHQLTRAVGTEAAVEVDVQEVETSPGDVLVLCSDGLADQVSDDEILRGVKDAGVDRAPEQLVRLANDRGGPDNITVLVLAL